MFYKIFLALCKERGITKTRACIEALGSKNMYKRWEDGGDPNLDSLRKLSEYFCVPISYLIGENEKPATQSDGYENITDKQRELIRLIPRLTDSEVEILLLQVKGIILGQ